jgi:5'(3')-deoxyribonucleotidase
VKTVGFDLDGVLYRFTKAYHLWMNQSGMSLDPDVEAHSWSWFEDWQTREEFLEEMDKSVDAGHLFWSGELYEPQIKQNIRDLKAAGYKVIAITNRFSGKTRCSKQATAFWTAENELEFHQIVYAADKTVVPTDYFIEDNIKNYDALDAAGTLVYLVNRPYNAENDSRRRVNSVDDFTRIILGGKNDLDRRYIGDNRYSTAGLQRK